MISGNKIYSRLLVILLLMMLPISMCLAMNANRVETFLANQNTIRILTDGSAGLGNQAASANVVIRLRQMGYKGKFEFIYPDAAINKISLLFDVPDTLPDSYFDEKDNIEFIKLSKYVAMLKNNEVSEITLGMTGVIVGDIWSLENSGSIDLLLCGNFANVMKTKYFVAFSPFISGEISDEPTGTDTYIYIKDQPEPFAQINSDNKFIVMPVASLEDAKKYLINDTRGQALTKQKPALMTLIEGIDKDDFNVMPVYGYHIRLENKCKNGDNNCQFNKMNDMLQIILGARNAQLSPAENMHKPLVITVFYDYTKEANFLQQLIHGDSWNTITEPGAVNLRALLTKYDMTNNFFIADANDATAVQKIQQLKPNQILLLSMGSLPKLVFDGLYNHTSVNTWPQVREGANTFNSLILTGKPHMRCTDEGGWEIGFNSVQDPNLKIWLDDFYDGNDAFCKNEINVWSDDTVVNNVGKFILDSSNVDSPLSIYFSELKKAALEPENDRIYYAFEEIVRRQGEKRQD